MANAKHDGRVGFRIPWKLFPFYFMILGALILVGMLDTVTGEFTTERLRSADFWNMIITLTAANILVMVASLGMKLQNIQKEKDRLYAESLKSTDASTDLYVKVMTSLTFLLNKLDVGISTWLVNYNEKRQIRAYKKAVARNLQKLEKNAKVKDRWIYSKGTDEEKEKNKYCQKRSQLEYAMSQKYIEENIRYIKTKYHKIKEPFLRVGYNNDKYDEDNVVESAWWKKTKDLAPRFLFNLGITLFISSFLFETKEITRATVFAIGIKVIFLISNGIAGKNYAEVFFLEHTIHHLQMRVNILTQYFSEKKGSEQ